jgi:hypothetical protein
MPTDSTVACTWILGIRNKTGGSGRWGIVAAFFAKRSCAVVFSLNTVFFVAGLCLNVFPTCIPIIIPEIINIPTTMKRFFIVIKQDTQLYYQYRACVSCLLSNEEIYPLPVFGADVGRVTFVVVLTVVVGDGDGVFVAVCANATEPAAMTERAKTPTATAAFFTIISPPSTEMKVVI